MLESEHEFSIIDEHIKPLPIVDIVIKRLCWRIKNNISLSGFVFGGRTPKVCPSEDELAEDRPKEGYSRHLFKVGCEADKKRGIRMK